MMNLSELTKPVDASAVADLIKIQFGADYKIGNLKLKESINLLNKTTGMIAEFKQKENLHSSENNASYMKLIMVNEAATKRVSELTANIQIQESEMKNKLLTKALKIAAHGGTLSEEQLTALRITESMKAVLQNKNTARTFMRKMIEAKKNQNTAIMESEIATAQTTIAAQDIADQIQTMIENSIRNAQGVQASEAFNSQLTSSLDELTTSLETAKGEVNNAVAALTGEEVAAPGDLDLDGLDGGDEEIDVDLDLDAELNFDEPSDEGDFDLDLEADDDEIDLGRKRR